MKRGFNLLKAKIVPPSLWTKVYDWVVGSAKVVIILTELLIVIAFVIRFIIDSQQKELDIQIKNAEQSYAQIGSMEADYRALQAKTAGYKTVVESIPDYGPVISELNTLVSNGGVFLNLGFSIQKEKVIVSGYVNKSDIDSVKILEADLKNKSTTMKDAALTSLSDQNFNFIFTFGLNISNLEKKVLDGSTSN